jgi:SnoaL-like domain
MKRVALLITLSIFFLSSKAQTMQDLTTRINEIEDRIAIKNLVDTFSVLADVKDIKTQVLLFTENAIVTSIVKGQPPMTLTGRKQLFDAFTGYLNLFETVYHLNGQQTVTINGDKASGTSYCLVTLIGLENGKMMSTTSGVYYQDEYVKQNGLWLIAQRTSNFAWQEKKEFGK